MVQALHEQSADDLREAMGKLENFATKTAARELQDTNRTLNLGSGATPESVN
jgi:hypothetical protein